MNCQGSSGIHVFRVVLGAALQRRPVAVHAHHRPEVGHGHIEHGAEVQVVGLDHAGGGIAHGPDHRAQRGRVDLQAGGVVVRAQPARLVDGKLRAVPVGAALVAHQQNAQLVEAVGDLVAQQAGALLHGEVVTDHLVQRQHRVVAGVVGVVGRSDDRWRGRSPTR